MSRKIFCIGLSRTGTTTFKVLMSGLGYRSRSGPSGLGLELYALGRFDDICAIVDHYDCLCDLPYPLLYERLAGHYPDSLFVLTTRRSEDQWLESLRKLNQRNGPTEAFRIAYGCYEVDGNEDRLRAFYLRHNAAAREFFRHSGRFAEVCWEDGDGLNRIGELLGRDLSHMQAPVANASADKSGLAIVERHCRKGRLGAAIRYAHSVDDTQELLTLINRRLDRKLRRFLTLTRPKAAFRRLMRRARS